MKKLPLVLLFVFIAISGFSQVRPDNIIGLALWLKADSNLVLNGSNVAQWGDCSGNGNNLTQNLSSLRPTFIATDVALNNYPAISFDGIDDLMEGNQIDGIDTTSITIFIVANGRPISPGGYSGFLQIGTFPTGFWIARRPSPNEYLILFNNGDYQATNPSTLFDAGFGYKIFRYQKKKNTFSALYFNGTQLSYSTASGHTAPLQANGNIRIGFINGVTSQYWNGNFSEIVIYNKSLSSTDCDKVENYLKNKYSPSVNLGPDINIAYGFCDTTISAGPNFSNYLWSNGETTNSINIANSGSYWVSVTDIFGFVSKDTINISFPKITLNDTLFCSGSGGVALSAGLTGSYSYQWSNGGSTPSININSPGNYSVTVTDIGACTNVSDIITVIEDNFPTIAGLGPDTNICLGNTIGLSYPVQLPNGLTYNWSTFETTPTIPINATGVYTVTVTDSNACTVVDAINVTVSGVAPQVHFQISPACEGENVGFINTSNPPGNTWLWNFDDGQFSNHQDTAHVFAIGGDYNITLNVVDGICGSSHDSMIHIPHVPIPNFNTNAACINNSHTFIDMSQPGEGMIISWDWDFGDGSLHSSIQNPQHTYGIAGNFQVTLTIQNNQGCQKSIVHQISVVSSALPPTTFSIYQPSDNIVTQNHTIYFGWNSAQNAVSYTLQYSTDSTFNSFVTSIPDLTGTNYQLTLGSDNKYFWRIIAMGLCGVTVYSNEVFALTVFSLNQSTFLKLWLKADSNVVLNGSNVSQWNDCSGNGNNLLQSTSSFRPSYVLSDQIINNYPSISFDGIDDLLEGSMISNIDTSSFTLFVVAKGRPISSGGYSGMFQIGSYPTGFWIARRPSPYEYLILFNNGEFQATQPGTMVDSGFDYKIFKYQKKINTFSDLYFNGVQQAYATSSGLTTAMQANGNTRIGYLNGVSAQYWNGNFAEIILFNKSLSITEQKNVSNYLHYKYAPPVNLGPDIWTNDFCDTTLEASERFTNFIWSSGETTHSIVVNSGGAYSVTATDVFGFNTVDTVIVHKPIIAAHDTLVCFGQNVLLQTELSSPYTFNWLPGGSTGSSLNVTAPATVTLSVSDGVCTAVKQIVVSADSFPVLASLGPDIVNICSGQTIGLVQGQGQGQGQGLSYDWFDGTTHTYDSLFTVPWLSGTHTATLTVINSRGCTANDQISLTVVGQTPDVNFTSSSGCFPIITTFTDLSTVGGGAFINSRKWNFGDGIIQNGLASITHSYATAGTKFVTLTVTSNKGCKDSIVDTAFVFSKPDVKFTPVLGCSGVAMNFKDQSTSILGNPNQWNWNFGDPGSSNTAVGDSVFHIFDTPGTYIIHLVVETEYGCIDSADKTISIRSAPDVGFTYSNVCDGNPVYFTDTSVVPNVSANIISWLWNFGNGNTNNSPTPVYTFDNAGTYPVVLTVKSINGCTVNDTQYVVVHAIPLADFPAEDQCAGNVIHFADSSSVLLPDVIAEWLWNFGSLGTYTLQNPNVNIAQPGTYAVTLQVTSNAGCSSSTSHTVLVNPSPIAAFLPDEYYGEAPFSVNFINNSSGLNNTYFWNFGDGTTANLVNPSHTFVQNDTFNVQLIAYNQLGCTDTSRIDITVMPTIADIAVTGVNVVMQGNYVSLSAELTNMGTRKLFSLDVLAKAAGGTTFKETWTDFLNPLIPGETITYNFNAQYQLSQDQITEYICVEAQIVGLNPDDNPANNEECVTLSKTFTVFQPYPSPAHDEVFLDFILPFADDVVIDLYGVKGELIKNIFSGAAEKGLNKLAVDLSSLTLGVYTFRVSFRENLKILKFVKY